MVSVPDLDPVPPLTDALAVTEPLPLPDAPATIVTQEDVLDAVHEQPFCVTMETENVPPDLPSDVDVGVTMYEHFPGFAELGPAGSVPGSSIVSEVSPPGLDGFELRPDSGVEELRPSALVAAWLTVNVCPATVSVPVRDDDPVFACTE